MVTGCYYLPAFLGVENAQLYRQGEGSGEVETLNVTNAYEISAKKVNIYGVEGRSGSGKRIPSY